jgi:hypothetical protein
MPREIVRADFEALFRLYGDKAVKRFNLTGNHPPQLYSVKLGKEPGSIEKTMSLNKVAPMFHNGASNKNMLREMLKQLTTPGSEIRKMAGAMGVIAPDIVVQINEAWFAQDIRPEGMSVDEFKAFKAREHVPPSERPDREEKIAVFLHAYNYTTMGDCPIVDKPKRHAVMGELLPEGGKFTGRLSMTMDDE